MKKFSHNWWDFKDKRVLVTGASKGLGWVCANILAGLGARLVCSGRNTDRLEKLKNILSDVGVFFEEGNWQSIDKDCERRKLN